MLVNRWQEEEVAVDKWTEIVKLIVLAKDLNRILGNYFSSCVPSLFEIGLDTAWFKRIC